MISWLINNCVREREIVNQGYLAASNSKILKAPTSWYPARRRNCHCPDTHVFHGACIQWGFFNITFPAHVSEWSSVFCHSLIEQGTSCASLFLAKVVWLHRAVTIGTLHHIKKDRQCLCKIGIVQSMSRIMQETALVYVPVGTGRKIQGNVYWVLKYRSAMHGYTHVISQSILHRKLPCHACYVIMFCPHKQILQGN